MDNKIKENFIKKASKIIFESDLISKTEAGHIDHATFEKINALAEKLFTELHIEVVDSIRKMLD
jgi:hypothetical protein